MPSACARSTDLMLVPPTSMPRKTAGSSVSGDGGDGGMSLVSGPWTCSAKV